MNSSNESYLDSLLSAMMRGPAKEKDESREPVQESDPDAQAPVDARDVTEIIDQDFGSESGDLKEISEL